jgi:hypothetical protein
MRSIVLLLLVACGGSDTETTVENLNDPTPPAADVAAATNPAVAPSPNGDAPNFDKTAALAKADLADGTEDKVAQKCMGCSLAMDGDSAHTIEHEGYALHMCSGECKMNTESDLDGALSGLLQ